MAQNFYKDDASIVKFIGDALIVMWPKTSNEKCDKNDSCDDE